MCRTVVALCCGLACLSAPPAHGGSYSQLLSTRYADPGWLPADFKKPAPAFDFVAAAKLPARAKVLSAAKAASGVVWIVTDQGTFRSDRDGYLPLEIGPRRLRRGQPDMPAGLKVVAVASDAQGHIWAATNAGVYITDGGQWWQSLDRRDGVPYEDMTCLHLAANGDVWGGTPEGAWRLRNGRFRYFWGRRWLPGNRVRQVWTDDRGRAWLDTDGGVACIEEKRMTLRDKADHFNEVTQNRHNRSGFICEIALKVPGDPSQGYHFHVSDNDGLWNAIYVGAMSFRCAATGDPAARAHARASMHAMIELERLTGIPGYPARAVLSDEELRQGATGMDREETVRVSGEKDKIWFRSPVDARVWCKGDTSSDELCGHYFAWFVYHDLVADAAEKEKIVAVVRRTTDHILQHGYTLVGHTGRKTRWGIWAPELIEEVPLYTSLRPLNSLEILAFLRVAEHLTKDRKYSRAFDDLVARHHYLLNALLIRRGRLAYWPSINHSDDEMLYLMYYALLRLDKDPDRRRILLESISRTWQNTPEEQSLRGERSPLYNFMYGALTGKPCDAADAIQTLEDWPWDPIQWTVRNSHRHDVRLKTVPRARNRTETDRVLPASERRLARWNSDPWAPDGGSNGRVEDDGAAWALGYWLGVYHGYLPKEAAAQR